jgi:hypothetical protein
MKKHVVLTSVASLLTFASVAVLPAFAVETGGMNRRNAMGMPRDISVSVPKNFNLQKSEDVSRHRGDHERWGKGERRDRDDYRLGWYGKGGSKGHGRYGHGGYDQDGWRGKGGYGPSGYGSGDYGKDGYRGLRY